MIRVLFEDGTILIYRGRLLEVIDGSAIVLQRLTPGRARLRFHRNVVRIWSGAL